MIKKGLVCTILVLMLLIPSTLAVNIKNAKEDADINQNNNALKASLIKTDIGLMDSPWPMKGHDNHHTGQSQYSTIDNPGDEKWRFKTSCENVGGGSVIDNNGTVYFANRNGLHAFYPNGTLKWYYKAWVLSVPAIAADGTIYAGECDGGLYAINPNGTKRWVYSIDTGNKVSSPAIAEDGTIYCGSRTNNKIYAINPNGTKKWVYKTGSSVRSSPAVGNDGTIYIGSSEHLYALNPDGTLQWRFKVEGNYAGIVGDPSIAEDGTVYIGSTSASHGEQRLYALYPNGTLKWKFNPRGDLWKTSASIGKDGTIYLGTGSNSLYAIYPDNGTKKWRFSTDGRILDSSPAIGEDGTIYIVTSGGMWEHGDFIAVNPDGTEKWRKLISNRYIEASLAIGDDGTVYVASSSQNNSDVYGYFHAFGTAPFKVDINGPYREVINVPIQFTGEAWNGTEPYTWHWEFGDGTTSDEQNPVKTYTTPCVYTDYYVVALTVTDSTGNSSGDITRARIAEQFYPPENPDIDGPQSGKPGVVYNYTFWTWDMEEDDLYYYIDWGDGTNTGWIGPYGSAEVITESHSWDWGEYLITAKAKDVFGYESEVSYFWVSMPRNRMLSDFLSFRFFEWFPLKQCLSDILEVI